ncbi:MAG: disulfide bond formation protein B [Caulobacteraceae bacterium]|nr:disulfide bond formation protein B [Caulobacter sp.]
MTVLRLRADAWLVAAALVCAAVLISVHVLQAMGWPPCELCLHEREVFWTGLAIAVAGRLLAARAPSAARLACLLLAIVFAAGTVLAAYHAGVEWRWWKGPTACTASGGGGVTAADIDAVFSGARRLHVVRCDEAAFRVLGLSLAGWNACLSAALTGLSLFASRRRP